jgi:large subunit ribosomal protein L3
MGIIGKKLGMTQIFNEQGQQIPVTVIQAEPNPVVAVTDRAKVGFDAVQLGLGSQKLARASKKGEHMPRGHRAHKAEIGHAAKAGLDAPPHTLHSFRLDDPANARLEVPVYKVGDVVKVDLFKAGEEVKVTGTSKGHGFQGVVKRWGFGGGPNTHGNTKHRQPGSIGPGTDPSRVIKGKKMPGQYGNVQRTTIGLRVERIDTERNLIYIRGAVAGPINGIVFVRKQG